MAITVVFRGKDGGYKKLVKSLATQQVTLTKALRDTAKASAEMDRAAKKAYTDQLSPLQKLNAEVARLNELHRKRPKIFDAKALNNALDKAREKFRSLDPVIAKNRANASRLVDEVTRLGRTGTSATTGMGKGLGMMVTRIGAAVVAARAFRAVLEGIQTERDEILEKSKGGERKLSELRQVATSDKDFEMLVRQARSFYAKGAAESLGQAAEAVFLLRSADADKEFDFFKTVGQKGLVSDLPGIVRASETMRTQFGEAAGSFEQVLDKSIVAASHATATASEILTNSAVAATNAKALGFTLEEVLSNVAVASKGAGGAPRAGTQFASFLRALEKLDDQSLIGKTVEQTVRNLTAAGFSGEELLSEDVLGRAEAAAFFRTAQQNMGLTAKILKETLGSEGATQAKLGWDEAALAADQAVRAAEQTNEVAKIENDVSIRRASQRVDLLERDTAMLQRFDQNFGADAVRVGLTKAAEFANNKGLTDLIMGDTLNAPGPQGLQTMSQQRDRQRLSAVPLSQLQESDRELRAEALAERTANGVETLAGMATEKSTKTVRTAPSPERPK